MKDNNLKGNLKSDEDQKSDVWSGFDEFIRHNVEDYPRYKLRAEFYVDVEDFINEVRNKIWMMKIEQTVPFFDVDFEFNSTLTLKEILLILNEIPDSHVMMDTVNTIEKYTGDRKYIDWVDVTIDDEFMSNFDSVKGLDE